MSDFYAKHIVESLRSGIPSREVGAYFSEARPEMMKKINSRLEKVREEGQSDGMIYSGRYGEGKTHLMNTIFHMATTSNMVVSYVPLGIETPFDRLYQLYQKVISNTYLPGAMQPGFERLLENLTSGSAVAGEMLAYAAKELETDKLYYLLKAYLGTQDEEEKSALLWDLEGDFAPATLIRRSYKRVTGSTAKFNQSFSKQKHVMDYFFFMSHLFRQLGYDGWVLLFDEVELMGRLSKKTRAKGYVKMQSFLRPARKLEQVFTLFAISSSYAEDVIDKKNEFMNAQELFAEDSTSREAALFVLNSMMKAPELAPLTTAELLEIYTKLQSFHGKAYDWAPEISPETLLKKTQGSGYLLRTRIRGAIEILDQLYQYGEAGETKVDELGKECFEEEETPDLEL